MRKKLSFDQAAATIEARLGALRGRNVSMQDVADLVVMSLEHQAALLRFLAEEFPDADRIRAAVFDKVKEAS